MGTYKKRSMEVQAVKSSGFQGGGRLRKGVIRWSKDPDFLFLFQPEGRLTQHTQNIEQGGKFTIFLP